MDKLQWHMKTDVCPIYLVASAQGLQMVAWHKQAVPVANSLSAKDPIAKVLAQAVRELEQYFKGKRTEFDVPLDIVDGTAFQRRVWQQLSKIPYGKTLSYSDVARRIKNPKAVRAVGSANGKNPLSIIVPCHRVIAADGTLGGYGGGLAVKSKLLKLEQVG